MVNRPRPKVEEVSDEIEDNSSQAPNGPTAQHGAGGKGEAKGGPQKSGEMEVD